MNTIKYKQILENVNEAGLDNSFLDLIIFLVDEKIINLNQKIIKKTKKFSFKNKYNKSIFDIAKQIFFYNELKTTKSPLQINNISFNDLQFADNLSIFQNLQNLISYEEYIGENNLVNIIIPMCKTEPQITRSNICDCNEFDYSDLSRIVDFEKYNNNIPRLPANRGIIKYLNALLGVICLIDKKNKIIDHNIFFEALQIDFHSKNNTKFDNKYSLYDSINIDFEIYSENVNNDINSKMFDYVNKIKNIE